MFFKGEYIVKGRIPVKNSGVVKGQYPAQDQDMVKGQVPFKGQDPVKGQDPIKGQKSGSCPMVMIRCAMYNPPNRCESDSECSGAKKCCEGSCGKVCMDPK